MQLKQFFYTAVKKIFLKVKKVILENIVNYISSNIHKIIGLIILSIISKKYFNNYLVLPILVILCICFLDRSK